MKYNVSRATDLAPSGLLEARIYDCNMLNALERATHSDHRDFEITKHSDDHWTARHLGCGWIFEVRREEPLAQPTPRPPAPAPVEPAPKPAPPPAPPMREIKGDPAIYRPPTGDFLF